jgi:DNA invertase Pin-like site-specific DNA recombinase
MPASSRRAAQYLRVSSDQQRYSLQGQSAEIAAYAERHGYAIVRTYVDAGISGLSVKGRRGLQQLLADVVGGEPDYEAILVYDVSRWGRFQNPDESAHYEYLCRKEEIAVEYCAEDFGPPGVSSALLKQVKRVMAAEYSRHLSATVARAQKRWAAEGLWQGGRPGYGLRRAIVDEAGDVLSILEAGQQKAVHGQRVVPVLGPQEEVDVILRIYRLFLDEQISRTAIVRLLNAEQVPYGDGRPWTYQRVKNVLTNPVYAGLLTFGRTEKPLGGILRRRPPEEWTVSQAATAVVSKDAQAMAARLIARRMVMLSDEEMLARLKALLRKKGKLSQSIIKAAELLPCPATYHNRFGSLARAYELIGYDHAAARAAARPRAAAKAWRTRRRKKASAA